MEIKSEKFFYVPGKIYQYHFKVDFHNHSYTFGTINAQSIQKAIKILSDLIKVENSLKIEVFCPETGEKYEN
jgi:hypothetical protein